MMLADISYTNVPSEENGLKITQTNVACWPTLTLQLVLAAQTQQVTCQHKTLPSKQHTQQEMQQPLTQTLPTDS